MFRKLQKKWKVSSNQFILIICVFAITGISTAYISRSIHSWMGVDENTRWPWKILLSLAVFIFGYQLIILLVGFLFGQFAFFWNYEKKILAWMGIKSSKFKVQSLKSANNQQKGTNEGQRTLNPQTLNPKHIAIFASGAGSNSKKLIEYFKNSSIAKVVLIVCNKTNAGVISIAQNENIPFIIIEKEKFFRGDGYLPELKKEKTDLIVLAGFLWKIPASLINAFSKKIINIHPALLPKYGGKGMYGQYVHESVLNAGEMESGITIHYVDEQYDNGDVIFQTACPIINGDTHESLAQRIHQLEYLYYPKVIEEILKKI